MKIQLLCSLLFVLVGLGWSKWQNPVCPFDYVYHLGDGVTDIGNSVLIFPWGNSLPAAHLPYGMTYPGEPNGRWSDGLIDFDFAAKDFGFESITPYLWRNSSSSNGVIFSVARSPVLDRHFFFLRGIKIPPHTVSLRQQMKWFKRHLRSVCSTKKDCAKILGNALLLLGDIEGNDIGYALSQGKSIEEVKTYVPVITRAQIKVTRELINMGATTLIVPATSIIGCYPYMLTARQTDDPTAYDELGCLKDVNELVKYKNTGLQEGLADLRAEFPNVNLIYGAFDEGVLQVLNETIASGFDGLKSCCGIGGKYNYDSERFCGSPGVPVCSNPDDYIFWDGLHFTHTGSFRIESVAVQAALRALNCTVSLRASM